MADKKHHVRVPPQDIEAEKAVLGSIMVRPGAIHDISDSLEPHMFYFEKHRIIYEAMIDLSLNNEPIDMVSVSNRLKEKKQLAAIGGATYLAETTDAVPTSTNVLYYSNIAYKKYVLRELIRSADHIAEIGFAEEDLPIEETVDRAEKILLDMKGRPKSARVIPIKEALVGAIERIDQLHQNSGELRGVPTGFRKLDSLLSGLQKSDLIILAARPSVGKTTFALDIARHAAVGKKAPVALFSLEMSAHQLIDRMVAAHSRVDAWKLRTGVGFKKEEEYEKLQNAVGELAEAPIFIDDQAGSNIIRLRSVVRRLKKEHGIGLVIIDYLQLMSSLKNYDSMVNQVTEISRGLKALAKEFDVPVLALSQLSRAVEARGGEPKLSDLRDSGSIEQDADIVMFLHRHDSEMTEGSQERMIDVIIAKHRNGPIGRVSMAIDGKTTSFYELSDEYNSIAREVMQSERKKSKFDLSDL